VSNLASYYLKPKITSVKPAEPNQQNQTKSIKLFSTYFVLIFTTNNNFVPCAILKKTDTAILILSQQDQNKKKEKKKKYRNITD